MQDADTWLKVRIYSQMAEFVRDGEGGGQAVVLHDGAGRVPGAHGAQLRQAQGIAVLGEGVTANVLPGGGTR